MNHLQKDGPLPGEGRRQGLARALVPRYARAPLAAMICLNFAAYYLTRLFNANAVHRDLSLPIDVAIPFAPAFIAIYLLAYVQWGIGYVCIARDSRALCRRVIGGEMIAKLICAALFVLLPTTIARPAVPLDGAFGRLTALIYRLDPPDNLFPSIHCLESWFCLRGSLWARRPGRWFRWFNGILTPLVFASTLLVKQHAALDLPAAVIAAELGLFLARKLEGARSRRARHGSPQ